MPSPLPVALAVAASDLKVAVADAAATATPMAAQWAATAMFAAALVHTFLAPALGRRAANHPRGSLRYRVWHALGEVELAFLVWTLPLLMAYAILASPRAALAYLTSLDLTEPVFVVVVMLVAATRPVMALARRATLGAAALLVRPPSLARFAPQAAFAVVLILGPLGGSLITEPAAMTVTALLLFELLTHGGSRPSVRLRYGTLGVLFVNVSIGGTLTTFAAPPVLLVARPWGWDTSFMLTHFGWRSILVVVVSAVACAAMFRRELAAIAASSALRGTKRSDDEVATLDAPPLWLSWVHVAVLALVVFLAHHMLGLLVLLALFAVWSRMAPRYLLPLRWKESLLVGGFLLGLLAMGRLQAWWLGPLLPKLGGGALFWGTLVLTAFTDNAALTYLGTLAPDLGEAGRLALVAGAVAGGGMTIVANAPNPAGRAILAPLFDDGGPSPLGLALGALPFTLLAALAFTLL